MRPSRKKDKAIKLEVAKLVDASILREAFFPVWIANPVMLRKGKGSWQMCIDYSRSNKACPKDSYPLSEIYQKVESLQGFKWKCFLDAYKGYHQVILKKEDEEKTVFTLIMEHLLREVLFGLKNARATYQRLIDKVFKDQIGRNVEVYVDGMVIKIQNDQRLLQYIEETLQTLEKEHMKVNPSKCTFGVQEGK